MKILRFVLLAAEAALLVLFTAPMFISVINIGNIFADFMLIVAVICTVFFDGLKRLLKKMRKKRAGKVFLSAVAGVLALCVVYAGILSTLMIQKMYNVPTEPDTLIVLGCRVNPNGPSKMLTLRLEAAYDYLTEYSSAICIVAGGQGADEPMSEAQAMYEYLTEKGIDPGRIFREDKSTSTYENLKFSLDIMSELNLDLGETALVTDGFHLYRAGLIAEGLGIEPYSVPAETPLLLLPTYWIREWFGISFQLVFG